MMDKQKYKKPDVILLLIFTFGLAVVLTGFVAVQSQPAETPSAGQMSGL